MAAIRGVIGRKGNVSTTNYHAYIEGGPELARKLRELVEVGEGEATTIPRDALLAAGTVIEDEWRRRVPVLDRHYQNSISAKAGKGRKGAAGSVAPRKVPGLPDNEQPIAYAARLEFGWSSQPANPSGRTAFDASSGLALKVASQYLREAVERLAKK